MSDKHNAGDVPTTGHIWDDDLADYTNQPPKWWMLGLTASALFVVVYWLWYPSVPVTTANGFFKGIGGWTAIGEMEADMKVVDERRKEWESDIKNKTPAEILAVERLTKYSLASGKVLFGDNCAACHGTNGVGTRDKLGLFAPILNDDDWLYGGTIGAIHVSIVSGRQGMMMAHEGMLTDAQIGTLANAVAAGKPTSTPLFAESGCTACHGEDGKGMAAMGSANLTDKVGRFYKTDGDNADSADAILASIKYTIKHGVNAGSPETRAAVMPSFQAAGKLSDDEMKKLAVYVYKFGGGQPDAQ
ncbi:MAG: c-type cytochrome [Sideroxyarcus sp.]|nr:c-type cytochrome [Sideroxyarcus sp.]